MIEVNVADRVLAVWVDAGGGTAGLHDFMNTVRTMLPQAQTRLEALVLVSHPDDDKLRTSLSAGIAGWHQIAHHGLALPVQPEQALVVLENVLREQSGTAPAQAVVFPATPLGRELSARLAVRLGGRAAGVCASLAHDGSGWTVTKELWGGRVQAELRIEGTLFMAVQPAPATLPASAMAELAVRTEQRQDMLPGMQHVRHEKPALRRRPVESARIVISGGRGMGGPEGFVLLQAIADRLDDAAVGGSLPTVDAGWVPVSHQVGQSGKYVSPRIYLAVGISGTPQHLAGIAPFSDIVAINQDPDAEIFRRARVGVVADWKSLLPLLVERLAMPEHHQDD